MPASKGTPSRVPTWVPTRVPNWASNQPSTGAPTQGVEGLAAIRASQVWRGLTLLAVEDSRYAAEALRLMCRRLGMRLRRAEDLRAAHLHLRLYRPDVVLVDLGLPDGRGEALIRDLAASPWRPRAVLATSGDAAGRAGALAAGADGFLDKPLESLAAFRDALVRVLPELAEAPPLAVAALPEPDELIRPDPLALRDDLAHAALVLRERDDAEARRYLAGFLSGVARHAHDPALARAATDAGDGADLEGLLEQRLSDPDGAFRRSGRDR